MSAYPHLRVYQQYTGGCSLTPTGTRPEYRGMQSNPDRYTARIQGERTAIASSSWRPMHGSIGPTLGSTCGYVCMTPLQCRVDRLASSTLATRLRYHFIYVCSQGQPPHGCTYNVSTPRCCPGCRERCRLALVDCVAHLMTRAMWLCYHGVITLSCYL